jgi:hypothetical protein
VNGPSEAQRQLASDPTASGQDLADLAATYPELHTAIIENPSTYPELRDWIAAHGHSAPAVIEALDTVTTVDSPLSPIPARRLGRAQVIAIAVVAALVVGGAGTAVALALTGPDDVGAAPHASDEPPVTASSATPIAPQAPTFAYLDEPASWSIYGDSLYRSDRDGVEFFTPGVGLSSYAYPDFEPLEKTDNLSIRTAVSFTGPVDDLVFAAVGYQRTPASGTTPEREALVMISAPVGGVAEVFELWELANSTYDQASISSTSSGHVVGIAQTSGSSDDPDRIAGVNLETQEIIWKYEDAETENYSMIDTMLIMVDQVDGFSITGCWNSYGVDIATGEVVFSTTTEECSYWGAQYENYTVGYSLGKDSRVHDRVTGAPLLGWAKQTVSNGGLRYDPISHLGVTGDQRWGEELRVFDTTTGEVLYTMPLDQVQALYLDARVIWDGKVFATTTDAMIVLDGRTGEVLADSVEWYPLLGIGGWTLYDDGLFTSEDRPLT